MREREQRRNVLLRMRMRSDSGWSNVVVRNISRKGLLIATDQALTPGSYIEICRAPYSIVARIVWSGNKRAGARAQDAIDIDGLIAVATGDGATDIAQAPRTPQSPERRSRDRAEQSRHTSSRLQYITLAAAVAAAAFFIASQVSDGLAVPFDKIKLALVAG